MMPALPPPSPYYPLGEVIFHALAIDGVRHFPFSPYARERRGHLEGGEGSGRSLERLILT